MIVERVAEVVGALVGAALAPLTVVVGATRKARAFHPHGLVYQAVVVALARDGAAGWVANRLEGHALVRFSSAWWKGDGEWIDALGCALRFRKSATLSASADPLDQDLLFATIRSAWTLPFAPFFTNQHSFLDGDYFAVSPFECDGLGRVKWRLAAPRIGAERGKRAEGLAGAVDDGRAVLRLDVKRAGLLGLGEGSWQPVVEIRLEARAALDQAALRFSPFRTGRGIRPRGLVHAIRMGAYWGSQTGRALRGG